MIFGKINASEAADGTAINQGIFHGVVPQGPPVLHQVQPQHGLRLIGRPSSLRGPLGDRKAPSASPVLRRAAPPPSRRDLSFLVCFLTRPRSQSLKPNCCSFFSILSIPIHTQPNPFRSLEGVSRGSREAFHPFPRTATAYGLMSLLPAWPPGPGTVLPNQFTNKIPSHKLLDQVAQKLAGPQPQPQYGVQSGLAQEQKTC